VVLGGTPPSLHLVNEPLNTPTLRSLLPCLPVCLTELLYRQTDNPLILPHASLLTIDLPLGFSSRDLETSVVVQGPAELVKHCRVLIQEHIPSGLYLDPYQLSSLRHHNLTEVLLLTPVDVEAPEYLSRGHTALVYTKPDPSCAHCYTSTVPLHIRYHRPASQTDKVSITLQNPKLLLNCGQGPKCTESGGSGGPGRRRTNSVRCDPDSDPDMCRDDTRCCVPTRPTLCIVPGLRSGSCRAPASERMRRRMGRRTFTLICN
uniref:Phosphatidylinositol-glycan biosynthesis class X protein n=1 Tax=Xenopus tropicalis TaxID=8364 RepID=A0A803JMB9_XENTR